MLVKNRNFGQKSIFWSKIKILVKNRNFGQRSKFWSKIDILVKDRNFGQKSIFWSKIKILVKNRYFGQRSKFWSKSIFWWKIEILVKNRFFLPKSSIFVSIFRKTILNSVSGFWQWIIWWFNLHFRHWRRYNRRFDRHWKICVENVAHVKHSSGGCRHSESFDDISPATQCDRWS